MFSESKVTEIYYLADDFSKEFAKYQKIAFIMEDGSETQISSLSPPYSFRWFIRFTTTFTSFSSVRLSAIISVRATRVLSARRLVPSGR